MPEQPATRLTRRGALVGAAWTAPVVVVAGAVPAFAASRPELSLVRGATTAVLGSDGTDSYYDLRFESLSVVVPASVPTGSLTVVTTFAPATDGGPADLSALNDDPALPWTRTFSTTAVTFTYGAAVTAGSDVPLPDGVFVGCFDPTAQQAGTFVVTATAPGLASDSEGFATSQLGTARRGAGPDVVRRTSR